MGDGETRKRQEGVGLQSNLELAQPSRPTFPDFHSRPGGYAEQPVPGRNASSQKTRGQSLELFKYNQVFNFRIFN